MEYFVGIGLALVVGISATVIGFDRDRSFYPTILVVTASCYDLFAAMSGSVETVAVEGVVLAAFLCVSFIGFRTNLWLVVVGFVAHGTLDLVHGHVIENPGVPMWWPMFCLTYDVAAAGYLAWLLVRPGRSRLQASGHDRTALAGVDAGVTARASFAREMRPFIDEELRAASESGLAGEPVQSFRHLERAHVLGQRTTSTHVRVHLRMLVWALQNRDLREFVGQVLRIIGATAKTALRAVPRGNTGGSNVSAFRAMEIPSDLAEIIARVTSRSIASALVLGAVFASSGSFAASGDVQIATVGARHIAYRVLGAGQPVILMISGLGDGMESFADVASELAKSATVIVYDRAGYGGSTVPTDDVDASTVDLDLSAILTQSRTQGPYVLVGHSVGGLYAEYFAAKHPDQVLALILEESRPADFGRRCDVAKVGPCRPPSWAVRFMSHGARAEFAGLESTVQEVEATKPARGTVALILSRPVTAEDKPFDQLWVQSQKDLAAKYVDSRHLTAPGGAHYIHRDQATWFVTSIETFLARLKLGSLI